MSSFRDLKNASSRDSKTSGILLRRIFVFLWVFHKLIITKFWKGYLHYIPPFCASSDCREDCHWSTAFPVLPDMIIILQTEPFDTIRHFQSGNTAHLAASTSFIVYNSKLHLRVKKMST